MVDLRSPAFDCLPDTDELIATLRSNGYPTASAARLCDFCSCTPAIRVTAAENQPGIIVRGEQQNDLTMTPRPSTRLEKEIYVLNELARTGFPAARVLSGGRIMSVSPARSPDIADGRCAAFRFFVMEYVPGVAADRAMEKLDHRGRVGLARKFAGLYARLHAVRRRTFGFIDDRGRVIGGGSDRLEDHLQGLFHDRTALAAANADGAIAAKIAHFARGEISALCAALTAAGYDPGPRLALYDSSAGNALVDGENIRWIDVALTGHFDPMVDIAPMLFCMKRMFVEPVSGTTLWNAFASAYAEAGGRMPGPKLIERLLRLHFLNLLVHNMVYRATHKDPARRNSIAVLSTMAERLLNLHAPTLADLVDAIAPKGT